MGHAPDDRASVHCERIGTIGYRPLWPTSASGFSDHWEWRRIDIAGKALDGRPTGRAGVRGDSNRLRLDGGWEAVV